MSIISKIANVFSGKNNSAPVKIVSVRGFNAASIDRLTQGLATQNYSLDQDIWRGLSVLRARSRDLCLNNDYAKKFLAMVGNHVVGPVGFTLRVTPPDDNLKIDTIARKAIEGAFYDWAKVGNCDVTGKLSFTDIQALFAKTVARDGECLVRKVTGRDAGKYGFQLQVLDIDRLDINKNEELSNGNVIRMGVEIDKFNKPLAYWIRTKHPGANVWMDSIGSKFERIPAAEILHCFVPERAEQTRGFPWLHSALLRLQNLGAYEEAAIINARVGASKMGFYTTPDGNGEAIADDKDSDNNLYSDVEPGALQVLPEGYGFTPFDPDYPHAMYGDFVKACLRGVASGLNVAYNTLSNDLEGVNFSSIRTGVLEERDNWMVIQNWMAETFLNNIYTEWLKMALLFSAIKFPTGKPLPAEKFDKWNNFYWQGRRWQWVDPMKDAQANELAVNNRFKSRTQVAAEQGRDFEEVLQEIAEENKQAEALGIELPAINKTPPANNNDDGSDEPQPKTGKKK